MNRRVNSRMRRKASGVFWIGDIPAHWDCGVLRYFAAMRTGHTPDRKQETYWHDCNIPWFTLADVWQLRDDERIYLGETKECISALGLQNSAAELLPAGTVIFSRTASVGFSGIMPRPMATTQDFWNWIPGPRLTSRYLLYLFRAMRPEFERIAFGTTHLTIYEPDAAQLRGCVPPIVEQEAIADYLDRETSRVHALIAAKRRVLELLAEKRKAIVATAVTRGLDPKVKLRDSGVPWLGEIPAHWETERARWLFRERDVRSETGDEELLSVSHLTGVTPRSEKDVNMFEAETNEGHKVCEPGDLVINTLWAWMGAMGTAPMKGIVSPAYNVYEPGPRLAPAYIDALVRLPVFAQEVTRYSKGVWSSRLRLYPEGFFEVHLPVPPEEEQHAIVEHIARETAKIDAVRAASERTVALLKERRATLIAAAVTGQLDVGAAA
jgi:type I restriction enzyme S subunit